jgi:exodeoxyribonuclease VII small subunit
MKEKKPSFEEALSQLDSIIEKLESGQVSMEELKSTLAQSQELVNYCRNKLREIPPLLENLKQNLD